MAADSESVSSVCPALSSSALLSLLISVNKGVTHASGERCRVFDNE